VQKHDGIHAAGKADSDALSIQLEFPDCSGELSAR
jgi:hypothetical protein